MKSLKLKVGELLRRGDFGRGIAKIDRRAMEKIGVKVGEIIEISGLKKTAAVVLSCYPADIGTDMIRMDGLVRRNAGVSEGELVKIRKRKTKEARKIFMAPVDGNLTFSISPNLIKQNIFMRPFMKGDVIVLNPVFRRNNKTPNIFQQFLGMDINEVFMGGETRLSVLDTKPKGAVRVTDLTEIEMMDAKADGEDILFSFRSKMPVPLSMMLEWKGKSKKYKKLSKSFSREALGKYLKKNEKKRDEMVCFHTNGKWFVFRKIKKRGVNYEKKDN